MNIETFNIGEQKDWKFGLITREVVRVSENLFEINDTSNGWLTAKVDKETFERLTTGKESLLNIDFE